MVRACAWFLIACFLFTLGASTVWVSRGMRYDVFAQGGGVSVGWEAPGGGGAGTIWPGFYFDLRPARGITWRPRLASRASGVTVPLWPFALAAAGTLVATRRRSDGHCRCPYCGYDLRGLRASDTPARCPECGQIASPQARPARRRRALDRVVIAARWGGPAILLALVALHVVSYHAMYEWGYAGFRATAVFGGLTVAWDSSYWWDGLEIRVDRGYVDAGWYPESFTWWFAAYWSGLVFPIWVAALLVGAATAAAWSRRIRRA